MNKTILGRLRYPRNPLGDYAVASLRGGREAGERPIGLLAGASSGLRLSSIVITSPPVAVQFTAAGCLT
jgi:hypothetical protein